MIQEFDLTDTYLPVDLSTGLAVFGGSITNPAGRWNQADDVKYAYDASAAALITADTANIFFDGSGVPIPLTEAEIAANTVGHDYVSFNPDRNKGLAFYSEDITW